MANGGNMLFGIKVKGDASDGLNALSQLITMANKTARSLDGLASAGGAGAATAARQAINMKAAALKTGQQMLAQTNNGTLTSDTAMTMAQGLAQKVATAQVNIKATGAAAKISLNDLKAAFTGVGAAADRMVNSFRLLTQGVQEMATLISFSIALPIAGFFKTAFTAAADFEQMMARVKKATPGVIGTQFDALTQRLRDLSKITPTTAEQLASFAEQAGQIGVEGLPAIYRMTNLMNKLVIGTQVNADTITEEMGRIANAFGWDLNTEEGMSSLEKFSSVLDIVAKKTSTDVQGIIAAVKDAAVVGPLLKIPADQIAAMTGQLISSGIDPSAAGTVLQRFFTQVTKNADNFAKYMANYKRMMPDGSFFQPYKDGDAVIATLNEEGGAVKLFNDTLMGLKESGDQSAEALREFMKSVGFVGGRVGAAAKSIQSMQELMQAASDEWNHGTTLQQDYSAMLLTTNSHMQILKNNIQDVGITLGSFFLPIFNRIVEYAIPVIQALGKAFNALSWNVKLAVVGIPLLLALGAPLLIFATSLLHSFSLIGMAIVSAFRGGVVMLNGFLTLFSKLGALVAGGLGGLTGAVGSIVSALGPLVLIGGLLIGTLKILTMFGLNIAKYFVDLANKARAWGENLMSTFGQGMLGGAVRVLTNVLTTIANMIASFFEAHSPPKEGPLSSIDQWGTGLMNTYLRGFLLADFDILSDVGNRIKRILDAKGTDSDLVGGLVKGARAAVSQLIAVYNSTGQMTESLFSAITANAGGLGRDIQMLIRYWLDYNRLQQKIADLEKQRKNTLSTYDKEVARISRMNIGAEQKAELIRQATLNRDDELTKIDETKAATQDESDAAKEKLDWQKAFLDAQMEELDLMKEKKKEAGSDAFGGLSFDPEKMGIKDVGTAVKDIEEKFNVFTEKVDSARQALESFFAGFRGEAKPTPGYTNGIKGPDGTNHPTQNSEWDAMYKMGLEARDAWNDVKKTFEEVKGVYDRLFGKKEKKADIVPPEWIQQLQKLFDFVYAQLNIFAPLTVAFTALDTAWKTLLIALGSLNPQLGTSEGLFRALGNVLTFLLGVLMLVVVWIVNAVVAVVAWITTLLAGFISGVALFITGLIDMFNGLIIFLEGVFTGNWAKVFTGILTLLSGFGLLLLGALQAIGSLVFGVLGGIVLMIIGYLKGMMVQITTILFGKEAGTAVAKWFDDMTKAMITAWEDIQRWFEGALADVTGWIANIGTEVNKILDAWFGPLIDRLTKLRDQAAEAWRAITGQGGGGGGGGGDSSSTTVSPGKKTGNHKLDEELGLATGGVALGPMHALIGEGGEPEVVAPLSKLPALFSQLYGATSPAFAGSGGNGLTIVFQDAQVRDDRDLDRIAEKVSKKLGVKYADAKRYRG